MITISANSTKKSLVSYGCNKPEIAAQKLYRIMKNSDAGSVTITWGKTPTKREASNGTKNR